MSYVGEEPPPDPGPAPVRPEIAENPSKEDRKNLATYNAWVRAARDHQLYLLWQKGKERKLDMDEINTVLSVLLAERYESKNDPMQLFKGMFGF